RLDGRSGAAARRITRQRKAKACGVEWARMSDSKRDCSSRAKVTWGARGTGIVELLRARVQWPHTTRQCPQFYTSVQLKDTGTGFTKWTSRSTLEENFWTPRLAGCGISPDKVKASSGGIKLVHIGVADVIVRLGLELRFYLGELVFQHGEVDADVMLGPELLLVPDRTVRTAPDEVSQGLRIAHHVHGDDTGGITHFQRPIDVKANELGQA